MGIQRSPVEIMVRGAPAPRVRVLSCLRTHHCLTFANLHDFWSRTANGTLQNLTHCETARNLGSFCKENPLFVI